MIIYVYLKFIIDFKYNFYFKAQIKKIWFENWLKNEIIVYILTYNNIKKYIYISDSGYNKTINIIK